MLPWMETTAQQERQRLVQLVEEGEWTVREAAAAERLASQSNSMQLRYLQTLTEIAGEKSSTIVFPLPMNLMDSIRNLLADNTEPSST